MNVIILDSESTGAIVPGADLLSNAAKGNDLSLKKDDWTLSISPELAGSLNLTASANVQITFTEQETGVDEGTAAALTAIDPLNESLAETVYTVNISINDKPVVQTNYPIQISVDVSQLNLTDEQKANFTGVYYDPDLKTYRQLGGEFSEDGNTFTFYGTNGGDYGTIVSDNLTRVRLSIGNESYTVNGVQMKNDVAPIIENDRTLMPVRAIAEALGATVGWDGATQTVTITKDGKTVRLTIGVPLADGMGAAEIINDRTFVPIRYISEQLGANVVWDAATETVSVYQ